MKGVINYDWTVNQLVKRTGIRDILHPQHSEIPLHHSRETLSHFAALAHLPKRKQRTACFGLFLASEGVCVHIAGPLTKNISNWEFHLEIRFLFLFVSKM
ncbi:hypothetical protein CDAR_94241 [Caerostris darwini]|uniref:Uncharacterized protein n=1 Tax=Caerostris darwini TaxID=1538125 RepID=A0AAV4VQ10_9ARAC|nr:hypothetical protein CDAR_94241 [Caerostris darwini]